MVRITFIGLASAACAPSETLCTNNSLKTVLYIAYRLVMLQHKFSMAGLAEFWM